MTDPQRLYTVEEYLAIDAAAPEGVQYEYADGHITPRRGYEADGVTAMTGASAAHEQLVVRIVSLLDAATRGRPCRVYASNLRVRAAAGRAYKYPDASALCGEPEFEGTGAIRMLVNPSVVVEILSKSTEAFDRGDKFEHYRRIATLQEYVLVAQDRTFVELRARAGDVWTLREFSRPGDLVPLESVGCALRLADLYERVRFPAGGAPRAPRLLREEAEAGYAAAGA